MYFCNVKTKKKILSAILIAALTLTAFTGCGKKDKPEQTPDLTKSSSSESSEPADTPEPVKELNPFTGLELREGESNTNRPVAIMINNISVSLPQRGIDDADIVYELPVEGAVTRLMAVFSDYNMMTDIGSVRSARHDYVELIAPYQPIYMHFGGSQSGKDAIKKYNIDNIEGTQLAGTAFYQDASRKANYASEHTWFANLDTLKKGIEKTGYKTTVESPISPIFNFADTQTDIMSENANVSPANSVAVKFSPSSIVTFDFDSATNLYKKGQYGKPHIDQSKNSTITVKNVLVMYTKVGLLDNIHKEIDLSNGSGYYISNGKKMDVNFSKSSVNDNLRVTDSNGADITMNAGQTWVCIVPDTYKQDFKIS